MLPPLIKAIDYEPVKKILTVRFTVGTYAYSGVPAEKFAAFSKAVSERGNAEVHYFNTQIEGKYPSKGVA